MWARRWERQQQRNRNRNRKHTYVAEVEMPFVSSASRTSISFAPMYMSRCGMGAAPGRHCAVDLGMNGCMSAGTAVESLADGRVTLSIVRNPFVGVVEYAKLAVSNFMIGPSLFCMPNDAIPCPRFT